MTLHGWRFLGSSFLAFWIWTVARPEYGPLPESRNWKTHPFIHLVIAGTLPTS